MIKRLILFAGINFLVFVAALVTLCSCFYGMTDMQVTAMIAAIFLAAFYVAWKLDSMSCKDHSFLSALLYLLFNEALAAINIAVTGCGEWVLIAAYIVAIATYIYIYRKDGDILGRAKKR